MIIPIYNNKQINLIQKTLYDKTLSSEEILNFILCPVVPVYLSTCFKTILQIHKNFSERKALQYLLLRFNTDILFVNCAIMFLRTMIFNILSRKDFKNCNGLPVEMQISPERREEYTQQVRTRRVWGKTIAILLAATCLRVNINIHEHYGERAYEVPTQMMKYRIFELLVDRPAPLAFDDKEINVILKNMHYTVGYSDETYDNYDLGMSTFIKEHQELGLSIDFETPCCKKRGEKFKFLASVANSPSGSCPYCDCSFHYSMLKLQFSKILELEAKPPERRVCSICFESDEAFVQLHCKHFICKSCVQAIKSGQCVDRFGFDGTPVAYCTFCRSISRIDSVKLCPPSATPMFLLLQLSEISSENKTHILCPTCQKHLIDLIELKIITGLFF